MKKYIFVGWRKLAKLACPWKAGALCVFVVPLYSVLDYYIKVRENMRLPLYFRLLPLYSFSLFIACNEYPKTISPPVARLRADGYSFVTTCCARCRCNIMARCSLAWPVAVSPRPSFVQRQWSHIGWSFLLALTPWG